MATTTPNYGWDVPTSTDYVKDGATAIETLGDDIDATLWTALGGAYPGLRLVKKQTIGTGVSSVTVTGAFSATYENYKIVVSGGATSAITDFYLNLGASNTGYYYSYLYANYNSSAAAAGAANAGSWRYVGGGDANQLHCNLDLINPFLAKSTNLVNASFSYSTSYSGSTNGIHVPATSYTSFTFTPSGGTITGGTIYVYGYGAS